LALSALLGFPLTSAPSPLFASFFFSSPRAHLHLHSFPTRRSSDLLTESLKIICNHIKCLQCDCSITDFKTIDIAIYYIDGLKIRDRKSTRLNSSHVSISYAVFCLKKKRLKLYQIGGQ